MNCEDILENVVANLEKQAGLPALRQLPAVIPGKKGLSTKTKALLAAGGIAGAGAAGYGAAKAMKKEAGLPALRQLPAVIPGKKGLSAKAKALLAAGGIAGAGAAGYGAHRVLSKKAEEIKVNGKKYRKGTVGSAAGKTALTLGGVNAALLGGLTRSPRMALVGGGTGALTGAMYGAGFGGIRSAIRAQKGIRSASGSEWEALKAKASHKK